MASKNYIKLPYPGWKEFYDRVLSLNPETEYYRTGELFVYLDRVNEVCASYGFKVHYDSELNAVTGLVFNTPEDLVMFKLTF